MNKNELQALIVLAGKVDPSLQKALKVAQNGSTKTASKMAGLAKGTGKFIGGIAKAGLIVGGAVAAGIAVVAKQGIELASNLAEVQNVVDVTFGQSAGQINKWAQSAKNSFGLSELQAKQFTGTMGAMLKSSGLTGNEVIKMSEDLSGLAGNFASFYNLDTGDAFEKIRSGISGETEPLKQLGINMSVANLEAFALSKGIKASYQKMDQASQTALRYAYLMEVSKDAQGDFARTQGSFANQTRLLQTNFQELAAKIMSTALPALTGLMQKANDVINSIASNPAAMQKIQDIIKGIADRIGDVITFAGRAYDFISKNWSIIEPIILGIAAAMVAATIAQWALNAAVLANPMVWIVLGIAAAIGILVAGIYALWKNWDTVKAALIAGAQAVGSFFTNIFTAVKNWIITAFNNVVGFLKQWGPLILSILGGPITMIAYAVYKNFDNIKAFLGGVIDWIGNAFAGVGTFIGNVFTGLVDIIKSPVNFIIAMINELIKGINSINIKVPDWVPVIGGKNIGFKIPEIPYFAQGGFANQPSIFGEAGLEAAIPIKYKSPRSISLLSRTAKAIGADSSGGKPEMHFHFDFNGPISKPQDVADGITMAKEKIYDIIDEYFEDQRMYSFS